MTFSIILTLLMANSVCADTDTATLSGVVRFEGVVPNQPQRDNDGRYRKRFTVDKTTGGVEGIAVWLTPATGTWALEDHLPDIKEDGEDVVVNQVDFRFEPRVAAVQSHHPVEFQNNDGEAHNVNSAPQNTRNRFNVVTMVDRPYRKTFKPEPDGGPIQLACDIHPWMRGWLFVFDHPYFAVTDAAGGFEISNVPPGEYTLHVNHPGGPLTRTLQVDVSKTDEVTVVFTHVEQAPRAANK